MIDMIRHGYAKDRLRSKLQNFRKTFFENSPIKPTISIECMTRLYVTSIGGWSPREFGDVSKRKVKHPGMIDC